MKPSKLFTKYALVALNGSCIVSIILVSTITVGMTPDNVSIAITVIEAD